MTEVRRFRRALQPRPVSDAQSRRRGRTRRLLPLPLRPAGDEAEIAIHGRADAEARRPRLLPST